MTDDAVAPVPRERGWRRLVLALALTLVLPVIPWMRPLMPVQQVLVLLVPALAACALVGWWRGGRFTTALVWTALTIWLVVQLVRTGGAAYDRLAAGWALLVAAVFGLACAATGTRAFLGRALAAVALALAIAFVAVGAGGVARFERVASAELERRAEISVRQWDQSFETPVWRDRLARSDEMAAMQVEMREQLAALPAKALTLLPALLALESLAVLALAWALYHRLSRARLGPPLSRIREFRFNDQLVWGLIVGVTLFVLPALADLRGVALNLMLFFGALYLLRGLGVLTWFLAPRGVAMALLVGVALLLPPLVGAAALWFGLGDTWFDWRGRPRPTP